MDIFLINKNIFDNIFIGDNMNINRKLKNYIDKNIFPEYSKNDDAHNLDHIKYVIKRSIKFAKNIPNINMDIVYTAAAYHDIAHHIDAKNHEKLSSEIFEKDNNMKNFFKEEEIHIIKEAIYDHRASSTNEPRNIYGKIVSSADRNTDIESIIKRTYGYRIKRNPNAPLDEIIEESRLHIIDKFGKDGYAKEKMYFKDEEYDKFLKDVIDITKDEKVFTERYLEINQILKKH